MGQTVGFPEVVSMSPPAAWPRRRIGPVFGRQGMVASAHPLITAAGLCALEQGGNAADAAVSAGLVAAVVMPDMCGFGGDLFALIHTPARDGNTSAETVAILGSGIAPRGASLELMREHGDANGRLMPNRGPLAVGVPGMPDAYCTILDRFGNRTLAEAAAPAIGYAADGYPLTQDGAAAIREAADLLRRFPSSAAVFLPEGRVPRAGTLFTQPDLARTLSTFAAGGADAFYRGEMAQRIAAFMAEAGGALSIDDLASHATEVTAPIATTYRGYTVYETGLPTQGVILLEALNIVEQADLRAIGVVSATGIHLLSEAKKLAYADRNGHTADPAFYDAPVDRLLSKEWARQRFAGINPGRAAEDVPAGKLQDGDTTFFSVVDHSGMMISLIQSVSSNFGCGVVAGDTGIVFNNRVGRGFSLDDGHPNQFAPGKKTMHTLNCFLVAAGDGTMLIAGGTPGGDGQPQWNLQMIAGLIDAGMDVQAAVEMPRWTSWPGTDPASLANAYELRVEERVGEQVLYELARRGHRVKRLDAWGSGGAAQIVARDPESGVLAGGSDPRVEGLALGF